MSINPFFAARRGPFDTRQAQWVLGVLGLLIGVVGKESLLGLILSQARQEITSVIQGEPTPDADDHPAVLAS